MSDDEQVYTTQQNEEIISRSAFYGLNRNAVIDGGELAESVNMCDDDFPALSARPRRKYLDAGERQFDSAITGAARMEDQTALLTVNGTLYYGQSELTGLPTDQKLIAYNRSFYLFPAGVSIDCPPGQDLPELGSVTYTHVYEVYGRALTDEERAKAEKDTDMSQAEAREDTGVLLKNAYMGEDGVPVDTQDESDPWSMIKIEFERGEVTTDVRAGDIIHVRARQGVADSISFLFETDCAVEYVSDDRRSIYITYLLRIYPAAALVLYDLVIERKMPVLDVCFEHAGRLWGARYGMNADGAFVNEIYCTALNDFVNWFRYGGTAADSWAVSLTSEGVFTGGGVAPGGYPIFFKEQGYYRIFGDSPATFQTSRASCEGVEKGAGDSAVLIGGALYYKSPNGIMRLTDALPERISDALGFDNYHDAVAGTDGIRYYVRMRDAARDDERLYVYNTETGLWHTQDIPLRDGSGTLRQCVRAGSAIYSVSDVCAVSDDDIIASTPGLAALKSRLAELLEIIGRGGIAAISAKIEYALKKPLYELTLNMAKLHAPHYLVAALLSRTDPEALPVGFPLNTGVSYADEELLPFEAVTAPFGYESVNRKYLNKMTVRAIIAPDARLDIDVQYDGEDEWRHAATVHGDGKTRHKNVSVRPVRCDSFRLRYSGKGDVKIVRTDCIFTSGSEY